MKLLRVNLSREIIRSEEIDEEASSFIGGRGLGVALLSREVKPEVEPLKPDNKLIFTTGALTGSSIPFSARHNVTSISPLTSTIFSSNAGGNFGCELVRTGYRAVIVEGRASSPVYLYIGETEEDVELRDASHLWGLDTFDAARVLKQDCGVSFRNIALIGPAGERGVCFANIMTQLHRAFGRGGLGAVMGSKNLKAIVAQGQHLIPAEQYRDIEAALWKKAVDGYAGLKYLGTSSILQVVNENRALPTKNYSATYFEDADKISAEALRKYTINESTCHSCPVACKRVTRSVKYRVATEGPEYETLMSFGSNLCVSSLDDIIKANYLCNRYGLDTLSTGAAIAALMEASEKQLTEYAIDWGDGERVHEVIRLIAFREGVGDELSEGAAAFAQKHGVSCYVVKGLDFPGHDSRGAAGQGLSYAVSNRGADHLYSMEYIEEYGHPGRLSIRGKAERVIYTENRNAVLDSISLCKFSVRFYTIEDYLKILSKIVGDVEEKDMQLLGHRIVEKERRFNCKRGFNRAHDTLPELMKPAGFEEELERYYRLRGWSERGCPE
jgi:aldehyde:ferredoxin oxidoreductase